MKEFDATSRMIVIKGQPATLHIQQPLLRDSNGVFWVTYLSSPGKRYPHSGNDVEIIQRGESVDISDCMVLRGDVILRNVKALWLFRGIHGRYWRIQHEDGSMREDTYGGLTLVSNCLKDKLGLDIFSYLKNVASISDLRATEADNSILLNYYENIDFIRNDTAAARFLAGRKPAVKTFGVSKPIMLIFPFGCNASQKEAVTRALTNQVSIIQGPPGTGKTQTILNIIANIVNCGKSVLIVSNNNSAVLNVSDKLDSRGLGFIVAKLGNRKNW